MAMRARICAIENVNFMGVTFEVPEDPLLAPAGPKVDALEQCATIARNMIDLFRTVISASGVVPELPHFTDKDFR